MTADNSTISQTTAQQLLDEQGGHVAGPSYIDPGISESLREQFQDYLLQYQFEGALTRVFPQEYDQPSPETPESTPPPSRPQVEVARLKKKATPKAIARAVAKHSKNKVKALTQKAVTLAATTLAQANELRRKQTELIALQNKTKLYDGQAQRLGKKKQQQLQTLFLDDLAKVQELEQVINITIDTQDRIIVTTDQLVVTNPQWSEPKTAGAYQIRIDFSKDTISEGIKVLNVTYEADEYQSPTIHYINPCWGNVREDIDIDFQTQNLPELVSDMLEYIVSPNTENGYLGLEGDKTKGWEEFFRRATTRDAGYSFDDYEQEQQLILGELQSIDGPILHRGNPSNLYYSAEISNPTPATSASTMWVLPTLRTQPLAEPRNTYEQHLIHSLELFGLRGNDLTEAFSHFRDEVSRYDTFQLRRVGNDLYIIEAQRYRPERAWALLGHGIDQRLRERLGSDGYCTVNIRSFEITFSDSAVAPEQQVTVVLDEANEMPEEAHENTI